MDYLRRMLRLRKRIILSFLAYLLISMVFLGGGNAVADNTDRTVGPHLYFSQGVHNHYQCRPPNNCYPQRSQSDPSDPQYPKWWSSDWTMYRVFQNYDKFPPPYNSPPQGLTSDDYEVSYGKTYYDSTYRPQDKDGTGAMMEYYEKRCLPVFPLDNQYTCSFVSLGNKAYFLRYDDKDLTKKPSICLFSPWNHPPRRDFIKHLPYNKTDSTHLNNSLQAYSIRHTEQNFLFGYAFDKNLTPDTFDKTAEPYRHPQSFYFAGYTGTGDSGKGERLSPIYTYAPIVSQNYTNFRMQKPTLETWNEVANMLPSNPKLCCLFETDCPKAEASQTLQPASLHSAGLSGK